MRTALAVLIFLAAIAGGLYVGVYLMFYMGIVHIMAGFAGASVNSSLVAWGIVQIFPLSQFLGGLTFLVIATIAAAVGGGESPSRRLAARRRRKSVRKV